MYRVFCWKKILWAIGILLLVWVILTGVAGRVMHTAATTRQLPIYSVETTQKTVALGINCAWDDSDIDRILQTLEQKQVRATFFLVGNWCARYPEAAAKIVAQGHELGSHSNTHPDMTRLSRDEIAAQLDASRQTIEQATGQRVKLFRPPSGAYNDTVVSTARARGWEVIQWDCDTLDWKKPPVDELVRNGCKNLKNGSILLLHAGAVNTADALPELIDAISAQGYSFAPVGELVYAQPYTMDHTGRQHKAAENS